ncbi:Aste57867_13283 [Aphanomyces stellatus]|uniref:Aste57867_13283 protein n=1 Tax=Aphanomyces stellatus TaxID=120398 RepID=A0A485KXR8_9STRA|nr:hypothetical protein As57867_013234 [Aphanomyces stellatus]VFT90122.1 Aste57867_13283 [Aphanomyces stellatus]
MDYTTSAHLTVALATFAYGILASHGHFEGFNMMEINRVGGIVWVDRPLLFQSIVAVALLSTYAPSLSRTGRNFTSMTIPQPSMLSTVLTGSETCWFVIVLTDRGLIVTKDHSNKYSLVSSIVVTLVTIVLSFANPVQPRFTLSRMCAAPQVDFELACNAGVIEVGDASRFIQLVVAAATVICLAYTLERWRAPAFKLPTHNHSFWLPAGATYLFHTRPWIVNETLFLDRASALMCGLSTVSHGRVVYLLDVKTWPLHAIDLGDEASTSISPTRLAVA